MKFFPCSYHGEFVGLLLVGDRRSKCTILTVDLLLRWTVGTATLEKFEFGISGFTLAAW